MISLLKVEFLLFRFHKAGFECYFIDFFVNDENGRKFKRGIAENQTKIL